MFRQRDPAGEDEMEPVISGSFFDMGRFAYPGTYAAGHLQTMRERGRRMTSDMIVILPVFNKRSVSIVDRENLHEPPYECEATIRNCRKINYLFGVMI